MQTESKNKAYRIARLDVCRLGDLEKLYAAVYNKQPAENYFAKKYDTVYTGVAYTGYIAYNTDDTPIAYYGVMPCFIEYDKERILAAQSGDTMTDPRFRYQGMFVELSRITFDLCRKSGIRFIFGFPNEHSYHGAVHKLGWIMTERMKCFKIRVITFPLSSLAQRLPLLKGLYNKYAKYILDDYIFNAEGLANSVMDEGYAGVFRDEQYLQYKTYSDTHVILAGKAKAWIGMNTALIIGDLDAGGQDFEKTMRILKRMAAKLGLRQLFFHTSPSTRLHDLFLSRYTAVPSFPILFQDLGSGLNFAKIKFTFADIDVF